MAAPQASAPAPTARSQRTRRALLDAAEALFAQQGFEGTRLEDVARRVGIRRASIVYHYAGKRALYDAVLARCLEAAHTRLAQALRGPGAPRERIEAAVLAWSDLLVERPAFARLLLRELAGASLHAHPPLAAHLGAIGALVRGFVAQLRAEAVALPFALDPTHFAAAIAGATALHQAALPAFVPGLDPAHGGGAAQDAHREALREITRRLLGAPPASR